MRGGYLSTSPCQSSDGRAADETGTRVGDFVLTQLARAVSPHGIAGRVGGDEIALFAELTLTDADDLARVQPEAGSDAAELLAAAERVLLAAKRAAPAA